VNTPKGSVDTEYLQAVEKLLSGLKERTYSYMQIKTGDKVLDVGYGPGIDTIPPPSLSVQLVKYMVWILITQWLLKRNYALNKLA
jgi:hypothetical protein